MIRRVIVLGGGSAGFLAALALKKHIPSLDILVIRSREIGIIGVGEGTSIGFALFLHNNLQVGLKKFWEVAQPTWKLACGSNGAPVRISIIHSPPASPPSHPDFRSPPAFTRE